MVPRGTVWSVSVSPTPDKVEFWASGAIIGTDTSAPFEVPLDVAAGDYKLGFCHTANGTKKCETTETGDGTGIVARVTVVDSASAPTAPASAPSTGATTTTSSPTTAPTDSATTTTSGGTSRRGDTSAPRPVRSVAVTGADASSVKIQWAATRDNVGVAGYGLFLNGLEQGHDARHPVHVRQPGMWHRLRGGGRRV